MRLLLLFILLSLCSALTPRFLAKGLHFGGRRDDSRLVAQVASLQENDGVSIVMRGGSSKTKSGGNDFVKGSKSAFATASQYWSNVWKSTTTALSKPFKSISLFKSKEQKQAERIMQELKTTPIKHVKIVDKSVVPDQVVDIAAKRSDMIGKPLKPASVQEFARAIKRWYQSKGYVLSSVTGATLQVDTSTAEISVEEPKLYDRPIEIIYCKQMVVDEDTGELMTFRQYKAHHTRRHTRGIDKVKRQDLNTTYVTTPDGKTSPEKLAKVLELSPRQPFLWKGQRWQNVIRSGIFSRVIRASPERMRDGSVQLQIVAAEAPPRNLEYGISKSLYTGGWEGEVDFEHSNLLGGGETLGVICKRGTKDVEPSVRLRYSDDKFGLEGGYDVEVFSDFIGEHLEEDAASPENGAKDYDHDELLDRKGATVRFRNPIDPNVIQHSTASASLEQTSTKGGRHESVGSVSLGAGPFRKQLPLDARSDIAGSLTTGSRIADGEKEASRRILPYSTVTATARQVFPLAIESARPISLAFQHSLATSTQHLPRHEQIALGVAARLRGYSAKANGRLATSLAGTTELRIPVKLPTDRFRQDASLVLFGDWLVAQHELSSSFFRKSSVGVGLRKSVQGLPLKYDVSYTKEGKVSAFLGLGHDFDV